MASNKIAIDFDSAITSIYKCGSGLVLSESTVAAVSTGQAAEIKAVGDEAKKLIGKTAKNTKIVFPVFECEIVNQKIAGKVLDEFLKKIDAKRGILGSQVLFSLPCGYSKELIDGYINVAKICGLSKVYFAESPILAALGQRIPLNDSNPCFIIDMAGGVTNIAAVSLDGVITGVSINYGMNRICTDIIDYLAEHFNIQIGLLTAERLRSEIGSLEENDGLATVVNGRDTVKGTPKSLSIRAMDIIEPIKKYYDKIAEITTSVLKKLLPEVSAEIRHAGIYISGIASEVYGLEKYYLKKFNIPIKIADNSRYAVALGGGIVMGSSELIKKVTIKNI